MSKSIQEIRARLRKNIPECAGIDGEAYAKKWLAKSGWKYERVEQGRLTLSTELKECGGKRPDFIVDPGDGWLFLIDTKYHSTGNGCYFRLTDDEIDKYCALKVFAQQSFPETRVAVIFMVFPKEYEGARFVWVSLSEFKRATPAQIRDLPAKEVSLLGRDDLWCDTEGQSSKRVLVDSVSPLKCYKAYRMDWGPFAVELIKAVAWPTTTIVLAVLFRGQVDALLRSIGRGRIGSAEFAFERGVQAIDASMPDLPSLPPQPPWRRTPLLARVALCWTLGSS